jgi:hypothetical protein
MISSNSCACDLAESAVAANLTVLAGNRVDARAGAVAFPGLIRTFISAATPAASVTAPFPGRPDQPLIGFAVSIGNR